MATRTQNVLEEEARKEEAQEEGEPYSLPRPRRKEPDPPPMAAREAWREMDQQVGTPSPTQE